MIIRKAILRDIDDLTKIYNEAILLKGLTCDTTTFSREERTSWFLAHENTRFPIYVGEEDGKVVGYIYLTEYRAGREAVASVAEVSFYVSLNVQGRGVGQSLLSFILEEGKNLGVGNFLAIVIGSNEKSLKLLKKNNFKEWGRLPKVVMLDERREDHVYLGASF